jgi:hypothetical protein
MLSTRGGLNQVVIPSLAAKLASLGSERAFISRITRPRVRCDRDLGGGGGGMIAIWIRNRSMQSNYRPSVKVGFGSEADSSRHLNERPFSA